MFFYITMNISGIYALTTQNIPSVLNTGMVDIKLDIYELNNEGNEVEYDESKKLLPGDETSFIPKVSNLGASSYIRVRIDYNGRDFSEYVKGLPSNFIKIGDYYYFDKELASNEVIKLFDKIRIPDDAESIANDKKLNIKITVDAVQENSFKPNYTAEDPWNGVEPVKNENTIYDINLEDTSGITIKYENNTENSIIISDEFLKNLKDAMPGDKYEETVEIKNLNRDIIKFFLRFDLLDGTEKEKELLNSMMLEITNSKGNTIYTGSLMQNKDILLEELGRNESDKLKLEISIPKELPNEYSNLNPKLLVAFSSDYKGVETKNNESHENSGTGNQEVKTKGTKILSIPRTGDNITIAMGVFFVSAICLIITIILDFMERKKNP